MAHPSLSARREAREAFFNKSENVPTPKFDPNQRERPDKDRDKEKERHVMSSSSTTSVGGHHHTTHHTSSHQSHHPKGGEVIDGYVGFANLPNQVYRKSVKKGFEFTLMVVGESGLGKSTLINSLFLTDLYNADYPGPSHRIKKTVQIETTQVALKEGGVQLRLTVVDTPGFGDAVDNSNCWAPVIDSIETKYDEYLNAESRVNRKVMPDNRVHCCLYFISPNGHGLKPLDVEFMKRLHDKVNIIPLIAKADTLTPDECREFKKTILNEIAQHKIKIYEFPDCDDEEENKMQKKLKDRVPFAVVGSNTVVESSARKVRGRIYPWGVVEVENLEHNDFIALRNMLIRTHMQDLKDVTNNVHYENFRYNKLASVTTEGKNKNASGKKDPSVPIPAVRRKRLDRSASLATVSQSSAPHTVQNGSMSTSQSSLAPQSVARTRTMSLQRGLNASLVESPPSNPPLSMQELRGRAVVVMAAANPLAQMEEERKDHIQKMKKMEAEMEQVFEMKVREKKQKLKDSEADLQRRAEQMKKTLDQQEREMDDKQRAFEKERMAWEDTHRHLTLDNKDQEKKKNKKSLF